jgi:hypothetical protein
VMRRLKSGQSSVNVSYSPPSPHICEPYKVFYDSRSDHHQEMIKETPPTNVTNVLCISDRVFPRCLVVSPIPATLMRTACIPAAIISDRSSA